ncbi:hypothetical protein HK102_005815, partial [Quaeritorhiza haematococci]
MDPVSYPAPAPVNPQQFHPLPLGPPMPMTLPYPVLCGPPNLPQQDGLGMYQNNAQIPMPPPFPHRQLPYLPPPPPGFPALAPQPVPFLPVQHQQGPIMFPADVFVTTAALAAVVPAFAVTETARSTLEGVTASIPTSAVQQNGTPPPLYTPSSDFSEISSSHSTSAWQSDPAIISFGKPLSGTPSEHHVLEYEEAVEDNAGSPCVPTSPSLTSISASEESHMSEDEGTCVGGSVSGYDGVAPPTVQHSQYHPAPMAFPMEFPFPAPMPVMGPYGPDPMLYAAPFPLPLQAFHPFPGQMYLPPAPTYQQDPTPPRPPVTLKDPTGRLVAVFSSGMRID